jgi:hypothetical protein
MKVRLFHRRLTVSSPRLSIRSALPWPLRWMLAALMLGFSAAVALWAFEIGKGLAGLDGNARQELHELRRQGALLQAQLDKAQSITNISESLLAAERAAQGKLLEQLRRLELDNRSLRDDLGFFEKLLPASATESVAIRGLQAERVSDGQLKWQVLVIQPVKNAPDFNGKIELTFSGTLGAAPWTLSLPGGPQALNFRQYRRLEGIIDLPPQALVKSITAKVMEGAVVRSVQSVKL